MINWEKIETVLLDMDGTLLDLNFDNHFWREFVPQRYAEQNQLSLAEAKLLLEPQFKAMEGKLEWYCLDYWSDVLQMDISGLKAEISGLISILPHVTDFLEKISDSSRRLMLVTNAHQDSLSIKMDKTCLHRFFDVVVSSHDLGIPKEHTDFWRRLQKTEPFDRHHTLLVDDSLAVLNSARQFGVQYLLSITRPDSKQAVRVITDYPAIEDFREILAGI
jgi:GMP/IMP 5'-nucleotidase